MIKRLFDTRFGRFIIVVAGLAVAIFLPYIVGELIINGNNKVPWFEIWLIGVLITIFGIIALMILFLIFLKLYFFIKYGE